LRAEGQEREAGSQKCPGYNRKIGRYGHANARRAATTGKTGY
jgi:hypothetical protein